MDTDFAGDTSYRMPTNKALLLEGVGEPASKMQGWIGSVAQIDKAEVSKWTLARLRRAIDFTVAALALTAFSPIMAAVALAVRLTSPGPVLFKQKRMGRNGCVFTLYKFRSMRTASDHSRPITVTGDNRITPVGSLLRKYKLDELPQFWNVLKGEMSLVGPRPKLPHHEGLHMPFRPGITGAATLAFRREEEMLSRVPPDHLDAYYDRFVKPLKARIDMEYMRTATFRSDLDILMLTAKACCSRQETKYRVILPEFDDIVQPIRWQATGKDSNPAFRYPLA